MGFGCSGKGFYEQKWLVVGWDGRLVLLGNLLNYNKKFKVLDLNSFVVFVFLNYSSYSRLS